MKPNYLEFIDWLTPDPDDPNDPQNRVAQTGNILEYSDSGIGVKHLLGRHDQKRHGWRGTRGLDTESRNTLGRVMTEVKRTGLGSSDIRDKIRQAEYELRDNERRIRHDGSEVDAILISRVGEWKKNIAALKVAHELVTAQEHREAMAPAGSPRRTGKPPTPPDYSTNRIKAGIASKYTGMDLKKLQEQRQMYMKQRRDFAKAGKTDQVHLIDQEFNVMDDFIRYRKALGGATSKHLRGRHDQKLHGNRGAAAGSGEGLTAERLIMPGTRAATMVAAGHTGSLLSRSEHEEAFTRIKGKFTEGGKRSWDADRRRFLWDYLEWVGGGKMTKAPDPKTYGESVPRAANHLRRLIEGDPTVKGLGLKAPGPKDKAPEFTKAPPRKPAAPAPAPTPPPAATPPVVTPPKTDLGGYKFSADKSDEIFSKTLEDVFLRRGWKASDKARMFTADYLDWVRRGKEGPEPSEPPRFAGSATLIRRAIDGHPDIKAIYGEAPIKPKVGKGDSGITPPPSGVKWDTSIKSYDPSSRKKAAILESHENQMENLARDLGYDAAFGREMLKKVNDTLSEIGATSELKIGISGSNMLGVLRDGRYKSQFETKTSEGSIDETHSSRRRGELEGMGIPSSGFPPHLRPVYGYMKHPDVVDSTGYGNGVAIHLKDEVKARTTFTWGDSLGKMIYGETFVSPVLDAHTGMFGESGFSHLMTQIRSRPGRSGTKESVLRAVEAAVRRTMKDAPSYVEIQIHGGLPTSMFKKISVEHYSSGARYASEIESMCKSLGIDFELT